MENAMTRNYQNTYNSRFRSNASRLSLAAACLFALGIAATSASAQPTLHLPAGQFPPCPLSGAPTSPCVTVTPTTTPAYFAITFGGLPAGLSITNRTYLGWCADLFGDFSETETYTLFNSYASLPPDSISNWSAVNWLLNHKPTLSDPKTTRDVIQQVIWELLDGGESAHYCCTLSTPFRTQYLGLETVIHDLYVQALTQGAGFVPTAGQVIAVFMHNDGIFTSNNLHQDNIVEVVIPPTGSYTTVTQGGWGAAPHGNNPGAILLANFTKVYPAGYVRIGGGYTLTFTSQQAIDNFLPAGGKPGALTMSAANPFSSDAGVFAGQVLALQLNVDFSAAGVFQTGFGGLHLQSSPLAGWTVSQVLAAANLALGGGPLPAGITSISQLNDIVDQLNQSFDSGQNTGYVL
jgi:hypothetical protein